MYRWIPGTFLTLVLASLLAACGGDSSPSATTEDGDAQEDANNDEDSTNNDEDSTNNGDTNNGDANNGDTNNGDTNNGDTNNGDANNGDANNGDVVEGEDHEEESDYTWDEESVVQVLLRDGASEVQGEGAWVEGDVVTITASGTYRVTGALSDGQLVVDSGDDGVVRLLLGGVEIHSSTTAPLFVAQAERTVLYLEEGSENELVDAQEYVYAEGEDEPNAALFSKDDLSLAGEGSLHVVGRANDGITSKDGLVIHGGQITVEALDDGIRGKDYLVVRGGELLVTAGGDGLKSDEDEDPELGYILFEGGQAQVQSADEGAQAETDFVMMGGQLSIVAGGGASQAADGPKGVEAGVALVVEDGLLTVDAADDALHSEDVIFLQGGSLELSSGDDGVHAENELTLSGGEVWVDQSYEAVESQTIHLLGGDLHAVSSDDGINAAGDCGGGEAGAPGGGRPGGMSAGTCQLNIMGGNIAVYADGDGVDVNGNVLMGGGSLVVHGPTQTVNGSLDYDGSFTMEQGVLVAVGLSRMAQVPDSSSSQPSVLITFAQAIRAGTPLHLETQSGQPLLTFVPDKSAETLALSLPTLEQGQTYLLYLGGQVEGEGVDGLFEADDWSGGTELGSFTLSGVVTQVSLR